MKQFRVVINEDTGMVEHVNAVHGAIEDGVIQSGNKLIFRVEAGSMARAVEIALADYDYLQGGDFI